MIFHEYTLFLRQLGEMLRNLSSAAVVTGPLRDKTNKTRTHSMARHRKSPHSRRNLMVIDPLTPSLGHQFYCRLKLFGVSWSTAHPL